MKNPWCVFKVKNCFGNPILFATVLPRCFSYTEKNVFKHKKGRWPSLAPAWLRAVKHCRVHWAWESKVRVLGHVFWRFWKGFWRFLEILKEVIVTRDQDGIFKIVSDSLMPFETHILSPQPDSWMRWPSWIMVLPNCDALTTSISFPLEKTLEEPG